MKTFLRAERARIPGIAQVLALKLGILLAFVGGPLLITEHTKPLLQAPLPFALAFAPFVLIIFGAWSALFWHNDSWDRFWVNAGFVGLAALVVMDLYAAHFFLTGGVYSEPGLIKFGIAIGALVIFMYVRLALRRLREERTAPV